MTEAEWLACDNPMPMLEFLRGKVSDRKLRLFACACCRRLWHLMPESYSRRAVEASERYADGSAGAQELLSARSEADRYMRQVPREYAPFVTTDSSAQRAAEEASRDLPYLAAWNAGDYATEYHAFEQAQLAEEVGQSDLLRDLFGNPFRPAPCTHPDWFAWGGGTVPRLAQAIYADRAFDRLPILGDALEDAGCTDADLLTHCRSGGSHVRGCWAVDLLLGKT
jgi:hypothetical protein